jgi:2-polyprenylphenol 6-hydroxylase
MKSKIVIVGAGPVGLAFALGAAKLRNVEITLIERQTLVLVRHIDGDPLSGAEHFDTRVYALSPGSKKFLESIGVWQKISLERVTDVVAMQVWGDDSASESQIKFEENVAVAHIVEHAALMNALIDSLQAHGNIRVATNTSVSAISDLQTLHQLTLSDGTKMIADLVVGADGARSVVRDLVGITAKMFDYESDGVVANFLAEKTHGNVARQWFLGNSVLAYLPLPNQQISIVWSVTKMHADELLSQGAEAFAGSVAEAGQHALGMLTPVSKVARVSLQKLTAHDWVQPGLALIGDAAHAIHPMAGQGANLGFADARALLDALQNRSALSAMGDMRVLRGYERARREDAASMGAVTHGLRALYLSDAAAAKRVRNQGLNVLNRMPLAKALLINHAMK